MFQIRFFQVTSAAAMLFVACTTLASELAPKSPTEVIRAHETCLESGKRAWETELTKRMNEFQRLNAEQAHMAAIRKQLVEQGIFGGIGPKVSDSREIARLLSALSESASLVNNIIGTVIPVACSVSKAGNAAKNSRKTADSFKQLSDAIDVYNVLHTRYEAPNIDDGFRSVAAEKSGFDLYWSIGEFAAEQLSCFTGALANSADLVHQGYRIDNEYNQYMAELEKQTAQLDSKIEDLGEKMRQAQQEATFVYFEGANMFCRNITNEPPIARDDTATANAGQKIIIDVLDNDEDPNNDRIQLESVIAVGAADGKIEIDERGTPVDFSDDLLVYMAPAEYSGSELFRYSIVDEFGRKASAKVNIAVEKAIQIDLSAELAWLEEQTGGSADDDSLLDIAALADNLEADVRTWNDAERQKEEIRLAEARRAEAARRAAEAEAELRRQRIDELNRIQQQQAASRTQPQQSQGFWGSLIGGVTSAIVHDYINRQSRPTPSQPSSSSNNDSWFGQPYSAPSEGAYGDGLDSCGRPIGTGGNRSC